MFFMSIYTSLLLSVIVGVIVLVFMEFICPPVTLQKYISVYTGIIFMCAGVLTAIDLLNPLSYLTILRLAGVCCVFRVGMRMVKTAA